MTEDGIHTIVDALLAGYDSDRADARPGPRLPPREAIVGVLEQIRRLLFPGYYADEPLPGSSRRFHLGTWVCQLHADLARVLRLAYAHETPEEPADSLRARAVSTTERFLVALPAIRSQLREDAHAALEGDPAAQSVEEIILTYPGFEAITIYRVAHWLQTEGVRFVPRAMTAHAHGRTGIDIHPGARIGRRFFIDHGTGVVIGGTAVIGDDVKMYQGVTLGALSVKRALAGAKRHPTIEDGVVIYAGATVLGGDTLIGARSIIGGNVWLTSSVPVGTTVVSTPPEPSFRAPQVKE